MRFPQLIVYDRDGRLTAWLEKTAEERRWTLPKRDRTAPRPGQGDGPPPKKGYWALRKPRVPAACLRLLARGVPSVLVLKAGRDLKDGEIPLLERVTWLYPDAAVVVVSEVDHPALAGLAWDLGASLVLSPPLSRDQLPDIVAGL